MLNLQSTCKRSKRKIQSIEKQQSKKAKPVALNLSSFQAHFRCQKDYSAHKTFNTNFEYPKMF